MAAKIAKLRVSALDDYCAVVSSRFPVNPNGTAGVVTHIPTIVCGYALWYDGRFVDVFPLPGGAAFPARCQPLQIQIPAEYLTLPT